ncbi:MAG: TonB family protein [Betaproteobacteria bacterium]|nr:TonB family protein [Betaproteobacteria bacterium]
MATELAAGPLPPFDEDRWTRLGWIIPGVLLLWCALLWAIGVLLARQPIAPEPKPIEMALVEVPPAPVEESAPSPPVAREPPRPRQRERAPQPALRAPAKREAPPPSQNVVQPPEPSAPAQPIAPPPTPSTPPPQAPAAAGRAGARALYNPLPKIPDELRDRASTTEALARFEIRPDGTVSVQLLKPTPDPTLNRAILDTLRTWRFFPATENGRPVTSIQDVRIQLEVR